MRRCLFRNPLRFPLASAPISPLMDAVPLARAARPTSPSRPPPKAIRSTKPRGLNEDAAAAPPAFPKAKAGAVASRVQALYELCKRSFPSPSAAGTALSSPPPADVIRSISSLMDTITPEDVGLRDYNLEDDRGHGFFDSNLFKGSGRLPRWARPIKYLHIYSCDAFSIGIFCLPTSSVIPLHDHPGMTVLSKILYGSMHVKSYDWIEPTVLASSQPARLAKLDTDDVRTAPCPTSVLYPKSGGNLHCFTSVSSCAVLDVLAPPYNDDAGRLCTYFHDYPFSSLSAAGRTKIAGNPDNYAWLEAINTEVNIYMQNGMYTGPTVQELQT